MYQSNQIVSLLAGQMAWLLAGGTLRVPGRARSASLHRRALDVGDIKAASKRGSGCGHHTVDPALRCLDVANIKAAFFRGALFMANMTVALFKGGTV